MKKTLVLFIGTLILLFAFSSCGYSEHTATFVLGDGREDVTATVTINSELYEPQSNDPEKVFGGWFLDPECTKPFLSKNINSDMTFYASWVKVGENSCVFVYDNGTPDKTLIYKDSIIEPKEPEKAGFTFAGWIDSETNAPFDFSKTYSENVVLLAKWAKATNKVTVTLNPNNGQELTVTEVKYNSLLKLPKDIVKSGYSFIGWYTDEELTVPFNIEKPVTHDICLYAKWLPSSYDVGNKIATETLKSTVKVTAKNYNTDFLGNTTSYKTSNGSGVIYKFEGGNYYCLTNNHVVEINKTFKFVEYTVSDCYGNVYIAEVVAKDPSYDLAVVRFSRGKTELNICEFEKERASIGTLSISIGNPKGLINSVTYGEIFKYEAVNVSENAQSNVKFAVGWHKAPINHGSSGGGVFNEDGKLIGINFAAAEDEEGNLIASFFIPIDEVNNFLNLYNIK